MAGIGIGIIGCGKATQTLHLPSLQQLSGRLRIVAVCDASTTVAREVAARWGADRWTTDPAALLAGADIDAVLICNPNRFHVATATAALAGGKHVLVEKPAAMSLADLDELIAAEQRANRIVQVGYMRRFAHGYEIARARLAEIGTIRLVRVYDLIDAGLQLIADTTDLIRDSTADPASLNLMQDEAVMIRQAIGETTTEISNAYQLLLRLGCHDLSALRGLLGRPRKVLHAVTRCDGAYLGATFDYGDFVCRFDLGLNIVRTSRIGIELVGAVGTLSLNYQLPYVRHLPARLVTTLTDAVGDEVRAVHESRGKDQFVGEWLEFADAIARGRAQVNTLRDAREDLETAAEIVEALKQMATR